MCLVQFFFTRIRDCTHISIDSARQHIGFPGSSAGKESTCNAGDPSLIPGSASSPGDLGCPLQYSCASLVVQMGKNLPAMQETWVWSLGWEEPLEQGMATHPSILAWGIPLDRGPWRATVHGVERVGHSWALHSTAHSAGGTCMWNIWERAPSADANLPLFYLQETAFRETQSGEVSAFWFPKNKICRTVGL